MKWKTWITWHIVFCIRYSRSFWVYLKKHEEKTDNLLTKIYVNKIENTVTLGIKTGHYLEFVTQETMKLRGSTKIR